MQASYLLTPEVPVDYDVIQALALYKKYLQLKAEGRFREVLEEVYEEGRAINYKPPTKPTNSYEGQRTFTVAGVQITELPP